MIIKNGSKSQRNDCEMFIIFCSVTAQTEQIILWDFSGTKKRSQLAQNHLFQKKFFFLLDMMHPITPLVPMSNNKDTPKQTIWASLCKKRVKFCFLLSPSLTHSLSHFHDIVASPPKGTVAIKRERFPHSPILYHYFLYSRIVCMMKYGAAVLKSCRYLT